MFIWTRFEFFPKISSPTLMNLFTPINNDMGLLGLELYSYNTIHMEGLVKCGIKCTFEDTTTSNVICVNKDWNFDPLNHLQSFMLSSQ